MLLVSKTVKYDFEFERYFQNVRKTYSEISNIQLYWKFEYKKGKESKYHSIIVKNIFYFIL